MISQDDLQEAVSILAVMMTSLLGAIDVTCSQAIDAKYAVDDLKLNASYFIGSKALGQPLTNAFESVFNANASIMGLEAARLVFVAQEPQGACATAIVVACVRLVLLLECRVYAASTFVSRQDVDAAIVLLRSAFQDAIEYAADNHSPDVYQDLAKAQAAIINHLNVTARPLPSLITYRVGRILTSHALAQRLYGDASRADQLVAENKTSDPHFMPMTGIALSA